MTQFSIVVVAFLHSDNRSMSNILLTGQCAWVRPHTLNRITYGRIKIYYIANCFLFVVFVLLISDIPHVMKQFLWFSFLFYWIIIYISFKNMLLFNNIHFVLYNIHINNLYLQGDCTSSCIVYYVNCTAIQWYISSLYFLPSLMLLTHMQRRQRDGRTEILEDSALKDWIDWAPSQKIQSTARSWRGKNKILRYRLQ